ncbi:gfo/Idh/MocA family oxidoreductase [Marinococcus halophilus]|uniref:Dehydrogenase n=1 Tax=Marinococcus halophilus TaxID=1371 RepID=A0A510Y6E0_MARHA|nr:Gfo/Idh/MocA family oxidoreductase [Marinococcus halophilus]OZT80560.1 gfo/Idh/MocA family oxidoreductase [Marinococcus halophilus]GEK58914.1 dehydrogenase [Marinococcus halophilus]
MSFNWGIIGTGNIAGKFAEALNDEQGGIHSVCSRTMDKAESFASDFNIEHPFDSLDRCLEDEALDIVYIATPHTNHYEIARHCLESGKHVFCEKAITVNKQQLDELTALASERSLVLLEAVTLYYHPLHRELQQKIADGVIGNVRSINVTFGTIKEYDTTNRFFNPDLAGGAMLDIGVYALSFSRFFLEEQPTEITTIGEMAGSGVDDQSGIVLKNNRGQIAVVQLSFSSKLPKRGIIAGDKGAITVENFPRADEAVIEYTNGETERVTQGEASKALHYEIREMERSVSSMEYAPLLQYSSDVMTLMDEARRQWNFRYPFE